MIPEEEQPVVLHALAEPFDPAVIRWKPQVVNGNRALAIPYIDARAVMDRLDEFLGPDGWQNELEFHENGTVLCRLKIFVGGQWLVKSDVGAPSEQPDEGDRCKAAASDALKRAAVLWGIGRYLYRLTHEWTDYDPKRKQFINKPQLPAWALPTTKGTAPAHPTLPAKDANGASVKSHTMPADGEELEHRLADYDMRLAEEGLFVLGDLLRHVLQIVSKAGPKPGYGGDVRKWPEQAISLAVQEAKAFEREARKKEERRRASEERLTAPRTSNVS